MAVVSGIGIGSNAASLGVQRHLSRATSLVGEGLTRLSSGLRINRASDDAAGLAIASGLETSSRVYGQGIRNLNDGISAVNIAQAALSELSGITARQSELAEQAANGVYSRAQRAALQKESDSLVAEFNRILGSVEFNGLRIFNGSSGEIQIQFGMGTDGRIGFDSGSEMERIAGAATFTASQVNSLASTFGGTPTVTGDVDKDGVLDLVICDYFGNKVLVARGNGDGTFGTADEYVIPNQSITQLSLADFDGDGYLDIAGAAPSNFQGFALFRSNGDGTFGQVEDVTVYNSNRPGSVAVGDVNGDGKQDLVGLSTNLVVMLGNGDGTFRAEKAFSSVDGGSQSFDLQLADFNNDGKLDVAGTSGPYSNGGFSVWLGNGDGTFTRATKTTVDAVWSIDVGDINRDGNLDLVAGDATYDRISVFYGNGNGTFGSRTNYASGLDPMQVALVDANNDNLLDIISVDAGSDVVSVRLGNDAGGFGARTTTSFQAYEGFLLGLSAGDFNNDGVNDIVAGGGIGAGPNNYTVLVQDTKQDAFMPYLDLMSQAGARDSLSKVEQIREQVSRQIGALGASQSRFEAALGITAAHRQNLIAAKSRIVDADVAKEVAGLTAAQVLQNMGTSILTQANGAPRLALMLLGQI